MNLTVYDLSGRLVRTLVAGEVLASGSHTVVWNGLDSAGHPVSSGVYFYGVQTSSFHDRKRMVLVR